MKPGQSSPSAAGRRAWLRRLPLAAPAAALAAGSFAGPSAGPFAGSSARAASPLAPPTPGAPATRSGAASHSDDDWPHPERRLRFPRDHGAHPGAAIEWWYATGWLNGPQDQPRWGFQVTFFRSRLPSAEADAARPTGRFAPRQLLFAHAALTDLAVGRHRHAQRISRWSGDAAWPEAHAATDDTRLAIGAWTLRRDASATDAASAAAGASRYRSRIPASEAGLGLALVLDTTQPLLLQGQAGWSRKGPSPTQASHYYSQPQLRVQAELTVDGRSHRATGTGWLDHEWSHTLLAPDAVGWDWIGINLADGGALTAFVLRRADGSVLWGGGSHRPPGGAMRDFAPDAVAFEPRRHWTSPATGARWPVAFRVNTPLGTLGLRALLDAQELDSRASTGTVYWEGLAELTDAAGRRLGLGYLEMTGRAAPLRLGI